MGNCEEHGILGENTPWAIFGASWVKIVHFYSSIWSHCLHLKFVFHLADLYSVMFTGGLPT